MVRASLLALLLCWPSLARSQDFPPDFTEWAPVVDAPVFAGTGQDTWDKKIRERGWILKIGEAYHLWYTGYNDDRSPLRFLGHATSADGLKWDRDERNPIFTKSWVEDMCVLQHEGGFLMFAEGEGDLAHALSSPDGVNWTEEGRLDVRKHDGSPISPGPYGTPTVWFEGGTWNLFYERGDRGVWLATSKDRKVWTNVQDEPVIAMGPQEYDRHAVALNQVFRRDGLYYGALPRERHDALAGLEHLHRAIQRPDPLGEGPRESDHRPEPLQRHPRPRARRVRPALHDAPRRPRLRQAPGGVIGTRPAQFRR
jgi:hypothetical protein